MQREYPDRPIAAVGVVVWRGDQVLLIRRGKAPRAGQWSLPGGAQEIGETVADTARREVLEETGVHIGEPRLIEVLDSIQRGGDGRVVYHYTLIDFTAEWVSGDAKAGGDAAEVNWVAKSSLADHALWPETVRIINRAQDLRSDGSDPTGL
ncbi:MAG TPA: NUDIX hydrolase [Candidatus Cybelea sp.]|nr:NUDIX hydrolase [Candidatus Cybelea sp.]